MSFFKSMLSVDWWIGVVIVGIAINVISAYLKNPCDLFLSGLSTWWATRSLKQREARAARIAKLRGSKEEQILASIDALHIRVRSVALFIAALSLPAVSIGASDHLGRTSGLVLLLPGAFASVFGMMEWIDAIARCSEIREARE